MPSYSLIETRHSNKPARYSANGKRVSKAAYELIVQQALMYGKLDCFLTRAWPEGKGGTKRKNYSHATY